MPDYQPSDSLSTVARSDLTALPDTDRSRAFLCREAIFDRGGQLYGHLFRLRRAPLAADGAPSPQKAIDAILLDTLNASQMAWDALPAFLPLSSASLNQEAFARLAERRVVPIIQLAPDAEAEQVCAQLDQWRDRGLLVGLFRQPRHPAFGQVITRADFAVIDFGRSDPNTARDFSAAVRAVRKGRPLRLLACNIETPDDHHFCFQWHFDAFHGPFAAHAGDRLDRPSGVADPHKALLLDLLRLVQNDADTPEIVKAIKRDPVLGFRILRYLNSPALGLSCRIESLSQALTILGRQRLTRWLAVLLFSVREPDFGDWLAIESALTRGRLMELLGQHAAPGKGHDALFLVGIFSCLDRLLRRPLAEILADIPLADDIRAALLDRNGPYAPLLAVAEAGDAADLQRMASAAEMAGVNAEHVNSALLAATAWASEITEAWD